MPNKQAGIVLVILIYSSFTLLGQKNINSPYSRFNIGTLSQSGSFRSLAMGGTNVAMRDNNSISFYNPASYTSIDTTSFIFDFGIDLGSEGLNDGKTRFHSTDLNFNHLLMGFPVSKRFGFATGIVPLSNGYYYLSETIKSGDPGYDPNTGEVVYVHKGTGSLATLFVGTGFKLTRNLSLGVNMNFVFGGLTRLNQLEFADYQNAFNQKGTEDLKITGIHFDYGLQYNGKIGKDHFITAGLSYSAPRRLNSSIEKLLTRFTEYSGSKPDTIGYTNSHSKDSTRFPGSYRAGIAFGKTDKFVVEMDYVYTPWSEGRIYSDNSTLANSSTLMMGIELIPDKFSNTSFLKRIEYRIGGHYSNNYLKLNGIQLKEFGGSLGLGLQMRGSRSKTNIFFDFTRRTGDLSKGMFDENIYTVGISLNLYDWWFLKTKYQ